MRTVCVILVTRGHWARGKSVLKAIDRHPELRLQVVCGGSMVLRRFKRPVDDVRREFVVDAEVYHEVEGSMAASVGNGVIGYATELERLNPDFVVVIGDRFEALAAAVAATYQRRCICHIQGGEVSGTLDEHARHAITKLAHYHAPATPLAAANICRMGEYADSIISVGCPASDMAAQIETPEKREGFLVLHHPNTCEPGTEETEIRAILDALATFKEPTTLLWPNIDDHADTLSKAIRQWRDEHGHPIWLRTETQLPPEAFMRDMAGRACLIGNSSAFVRDSGMVGTPTVLVGNRQDGREAAGNVLVSEVSSGHIRDAILRAREMGVQRSTLYGDGQVGRRIAQRLAEVEPYIQKRLCYGNQTEEVPTAVVEAHTAAGIVH